MNDIAIDVDTKRAYISDSKRGRIVVYDSKSQDSWTIQHPATLADNLAVSSSETALSKTKLGQSLHTFR